VPDDDPLLSAAVVLRSARGRTPDPSAAITAAGVGDHLPPAEAVESAQAFFRQAGFAVAAGFATAFSITGPRSLFERTFGDRLRTGPVAGSTAATREDGALELSLERLPAAVACQLAAVAFSSPPDFGPGNP
jgi:hypothetical protein